MVSFLAKISPQRCDDVKIVEVSDFETSFHNEITLQFVPRVFVLTADFLTEGKTTFRASETEPDCYVQAHHLLEKTH